MQNEFKDVFYNMGNVVIFFNNYKWKGNFINCIIGNKRKEKEGRREERKENNNSFWRSQRQN